MCLVKFCSIKPPKGRFSIKTDKTKCAIGNRGQDRELSIFIL
jgi:hypothetical protein